MVTLHCRTVSVPSHVPLPFVDYQGHNIVLELQREHKLFIDVVFDVVESECKMCDE